MGLANWIGRNLRRLPGVRTMARLALEDYGHDPNIGTASTRGGKLDIGYDEPSYRAGDAGNAAEWPDPVFEVNTKGHLLVRTCPPAIIAFRKIGNRVVKLDWQPRGGNAKRREQMTYMVQHTPGWADMLRWFCWAEADGLRFGQIKTLDPRFNTSQWVLPDLRAGGRLKLRAGGRLHWDGTNLYVAQTATAFELKEAERVKDRSEVMIHRPGAGSSPAGDMDLGVALLNLCESWWDGFNADKVYKRRYNQEIYRSGRTQQRPPNIQASYQAAARKVVELQEAGPEGVIVIPDKDDIELRKLQTNGLQDLWHSMDKSAGIIYLLVVASKITSDTSDAGGVGSSGVGLSEELAAALAIAGSIADGPINMGLVPWLANMNEEFLQPLAEGEEEVYFVPEAPTVGAAGDIGDDGKDEPGADQEDPAGDNPGEDGRQGNPPAGGARATLHSLGRNMATLAKPTGLVLPPVHPNCRCFLVEDGRVVGGFRGDSGAAALEDGWYDAKDSKVCRECRVYGAIYNALLRGPVKLSPQEADAMAAARESKAYKSALERDTAGENEAIARAAEVDREGLIQQTTKARGLVPNAAELNEAVEAALDKSRAAADVQAGVNVRGFVSPEAVVAPPVGAGPGAAVRPQYVGAVIASGNAYTLLQRNYRWHLINARTGKVVALEDSLHLGLLVFLALEYANQKAHERRRQERMAGSAT